MSSNELQCVKMNTNLFWIPNKTNQGFFHLDVTFPVGLLSEDEQNLEYSHLIEHLFTHHTSHKYPDSKKNREFIQLAGISNNATTFMEHTSHVYYGSCDYFEEAVDLILCTICNFKLLDRDVHKEKRSCVQELVEYQSDEHRNNSLSSRLMYSKHRDNISIEALVASIENATVEKLSRFFSEAYNIHNVCFTMFSTYKFADVLKKKLEIMKMHTTKSERTKNSWYYKPLVLSKDVIYIAHGKEIVHASKYNRFDMCYIKHTQKVIAEKDLIEVRYSMEYVSTFLKKYLMHVLRDFKNLVYYVEVNFHCTKMVKPGERHIEIVIKSTCESQEDATNALSVIDECMEKCITHQTGDTTIREILENQKHALKSSLIYRDVVESIANRAINLTSCNVDNFNDEYFQSGFSEAEIDHARLSYDLGNIHPVICELMRQHASKFVHCYL